MNVRRRAPTENDWPEILAVANESLPGAPDGNQGWLAARRGLDPTVTRRHYVVEDDFGKVIAYGGIEASRLPGWFRAFLVTRPDRLHRIGDQLFGALVQDARALHARVLWMREHADDPLVAFMVARRFKEARHYVLGPETGAYAGVEVVELEFRLADR